MKRAPHRLDEHGNCKRCGYGVLSINYLESIRVNCPPGFWMTVDECKQWDAAAEGERRELEKKFLERRP